MMQRISQILPAGGALFANRAAPAATSLETAAAAGYATAVAISGAVESARVPSSYGAVVDAAKLVREQMSGQALSLANSRPQVLMMIEG